MNTPTFTRRDLPADITVLSGDIATQPLVFAHLLDEAPDMDLSHVEVIQSGHDARLRVYFDEATTARLSGAAPTLVLILPAARPSLEYPVGETAHLTLLGTIRGTVSHLSAAP